MKEKSAGKRKTPVSNEPSQDMEDIAAIYSEEESEPDPDMEDIEDIAAIYSEEESEPDPDIIDFLNQEDVEDTAAIFSEEESELEPEIIGFLAQGASESHLEPSVSQNSLGSSSSLGDSGSRLCGAGDLGSNRQKKMVHFNEKGQPIGDGSTAFNTQLGALMRRHCPISYEQWRDVPDQTKDTIWRLVTDEYIVPMAYKQKILDRVNKYWTSFKSMLWSRHFDIYDTDEERKRDCPKGVKQDVSEIFVDNQSTSIAQARQKSGKLAKQTMKIPHTSSRTGAARTAEALEEIKNILEQNPSSINLDVDHDPVAHVYGPEKKGFVQSMGIGVSKTSLRDSAPAVEIHPKRLFPPTDEDEEQIADHREQVASQGSAHIVDQLEEEILQFSAEEQIAFLDDQVVLQREQLEELQQERVARLSAEAQITELKQQLTSQGKMIADLNELIKSRFS